MIIMSTEAADVRLDASATKMWSETESTPGVVRARNDYYEGRDFFVVAHAELITYRTAAITSTRRALSCS